MTINPLTFNAYSVDVAPELRRKAIAQVRTAHEKPSQSSSPLQKPDIATTSVEFVHSLGFVEDVKQPVPQILQKGIPVVQRLNLSW